MTCYPKDRPVLEIAEQLHAGARERSEAVGDTLFILGLCALSLVLGAGLALVVLGFDVALARFASIGGVL